MGIAFMPNISSRFYPVEQVIGEVRTIIIDPHNEIMPYWFREFLQQKRSLISVRIDAHHDMFHCCPALPAREGREIFHFLARHMLYLEEYSRRKVNEGNFTCPTFHYGVVRSLYHFQPSLNRMDAYGRVSGSETMGEPKTAEKRIESPAGKGKWIVWDQETAQRPLPCP
jgi:hypothetical protein